jgi:hypothetical protein
MPTCLSRGLFSLVASVLWVGCVTTTGAGEVKRTLLQFEPSSVKSGWSRVRTAQFELHTDLTPALAERAALLLTQSLGGLEAMFARIPRVGENRLTIIAMSDSGEFERRFGKRLAGFAISSREDTTVCVYGPPDRWFERQSPNYEGVSSVLQHELAHAVLRSYFPRQPRWFAEGLAQYIETARWVDAETLLLNEPNLEAYQKYNLVRSLQMSDLLAWDKIEAAQKRETGMYGLSWAFVHYALNREPEVFGTFMSRLRSEEPETAWKETFGGRGDALDKAIHAYMKVGEYRQGAMKLPLGTPAATRVEPGDEPLVNALLSSFEQALKGAQKEP